MTLKREQLRELLKSAMPLIKWIKKNGHPHVSAIVTAESVELVETLARTFEPSKNIPRKNSTAIFESITSISKFENDPNGSEAHSIPPAQTK